MSPTDASRHFTALRKARRYRGISGIEWERRLLVTVTTDFLAPDVLNRCGGAGPALMPVAEGPPSLDGPPQRRASLQQIFHDNVLG
jgi:hypothetical protein